MNRSLARVPLPARPCIRLTVLAGLVVSVIRDASLEGRLNDPPIQALSAGTGLSATITFGVLMSLILDGYGHTLAYVAAGGMAAIVGGLVAAYFVHDSAKR